MSLTGQLRYGGEKRGRRTFAWLPVRCYRMRAPSPFVARIGWYWLTPVTVTMTFFDGWRAYVHDKAGVPVRSDHLVISVRGCARRRASDRCRHTLARCSPDPLAFILTIAEQEPKMPTICKAANADSDYRLRR